MRHLLCWLLGRAVMGMTDANYSSKLETAIAAPTNETNTTRQRLSISPKAWLFGADNRHRPKKMRVALLMAGNVRTHDQCAPSIRKNLLEHKYNDRWRFEIVALAYGIHVHGAAQHRLDVPAVRGIGGFVVARTDGVPLAVVYGHFGPC